MAENTAISWADDTFNPWEGCQETGSPACVPCYARERNRRYSTVVDEAGDKVAPNWGPHAPRRRTSVQNWNKPLKWDRERAAAIANYRSCEAYKERHGGAGISAPYPPPRFVFCASLADVFDNAVPSEWRRDLFDLIRATPNLTWLLLTKRPQNIVKLFREITDLDQEHDELSDYWPSNAAIGCTVVTQAEANRDIPWLLQAKAILKPAFAFVSMEPLMERVDLTRIGARDGHTMNALIGGWVDEVENDNKHLPALDWVITGGMTSQGKFKAKPADPAWFRLLRDQCANAGVAFEFKQWGEWVPYSIRDGRVVTISALTGSPEVHDHGRVYRNEEIVIFRHNDDYEVLAKVGKHADPCTLDGVHHHARPEVRSAA